MKRIFLGIVISLATFGLLSTIGGGVFLSKSVGAKSWPTASGTVILSEIVMSVDDGKKKYRPIIRYSYLVGPNHYEGHKVALGSMSTQSYAKRVSDEYPEGKKVKVFYNPRDPGDSLLEVGLSPILIAFIIFGILFLIISFILYWQRDRIILTVESLTEANKRHDKKAG